jgi:serine/threonine protein kinase
MQAPWFVCCLMEPHLCLHCPVPQDAIDQGAFFKDTSDAPHSRRHQQHPSPPPAPAAAAAGRAAPHGLNLAAIFTTSQEVAAALHHLHNCGVVHGDLSAFNVLLSSHGPKAAAAGRGWSVRVADFGLCRLLAADGSTLVDDRSTPRPHGTPGYMAPEVLRGVPPTAAADVYSFGVLLWQMCTGRRPWSGLSPQQVAQAVMAGGNVLQAGTASIPGALRELLGRCLCPHPAGRPTCKQLLAELGPVVELIAAVDVCGRKDQD